MKATEVPLDVRHGRGTIALAALTTLCPVVILISLPSFDVPWGVTGQAFDWLRNAMPDQDLTSADLEYLLEGDAVGCVFLDRQPVDAQTIRLAQAFRTGAVALAAELRRRPDGAIFPTYADYLYELIQQIDHDFPSGRGA